MIDLVGVANRGLDALIAISNTIVVIIAAVIVIIAIVCIIVGVSVVVSVVNLDNQLELGCTPLIDVGYCYDVINIVVVFNFVNLGIDDCRAIHSYDDIKWCKVHILCILVGGSHP